MQKVYFLILQKEFFQDLQVSYMLNAAALDFKLEFFNDIQKFEEAVQKNKPDLAVISYDALSKKEELTLDTEIAYHAKSEDEMASGSAYGFKTIGIAKNPDALYKKIQKGPYTYQAGNTTVQPRVSSRAKSEKTPVTEKAPALQAKPEAKVSSNNADAMLGIERSSSSKQAKPETPAKPAAPAKKASGSKADNTVKKLEESLSVDDFFAALNASKSQTATEDKPAVLPGSSRQSAEPVYINYEPDETIEEQEPVKEPPREKPKPVTDYTPQRRDAIDEEVLRDVGHKEKKTKVITVYSAKGGVGKTKISSELALYLSMIKAGEKNLRVLIIDCNIDFGDVRTTLGLEAKGPNMAIWADEIKEMMENSSEEIVYSKEEIEKKLRYDEASGLYILPAPLTNEDSYIINLDIMKVIFRNLIDHGEFDYIVCDTGNNTRDSTTIALEMADIVLMVATQDYNTVNCLMSFLRALRYMDEDDLSKYKVVVNKIRPEKLTTISVPDVLECFNEYDKDGNVTFEHKCVGKIKYDPDVEISSNKKEPLAFKPGHPFIKQMRSIVQYILEGEVFEEEEEPKKKAFSLFGIKSRKKKKEKRKG